MLEYFKENPNHHIILFIDILNYISDTWKPQYHYITTSIFYNNLLIVSNTQHVINFPHLFKNSFLLVYLNQDPEKPHTLPMVDTFWVPFKIYDDFFLNFCFNFLNFLYIFWIILFFHAIFFCWRNVIFCLL